MKPLYDANELYIDAQGGLWDGSRNVTREPVSDLPSQLSKLSTINGLGGTRIERFAVHNNLDVGISRDILRRVTRGKEVWWDVERIAAESGKAVANS